MAEETAEGDQLVVREVSAMIGDWERSDDLASELAVRLVAYFKKRET